MKSSNIMLTKERRAKVADVGVAVMSGHLPFFQAAGTFSYAAPELLIGYKCTCKVRPQFRTARGCVTTLFT